MLLHMKPLTSYFFATCVVSSCLLVVTAVCVLFLLKLKWQKNKSVFVVSFSSAQFQQIIFDCCSKWTFPANRGLFFFVIGRGLVSKLLFCINKSLQLEIYKITLLKSFISVPFQSLLLKHLCHTCFAYKDTLQTDHN